MTCSSAIPEPPDEFLELSREIGSDPMLVQGPGGNTSVKFGNSMWIKASGTRLADAGKRRIFIPVSVERAIAEIDAGGGAPAPDSRLHEDDELRPSIETSFHALLPHRYVFHYHSVNSLAHLATGEGTAAAVAKLAELDPVPVDYQRPGTPLSRAIRTAIAGRESMVILLGNHGMIICGDTIAEIRARLQATETLLELPPVAAARQYPDPPSFHGWVPLPDLLPRLLEPGLIERMAGGCLFPDQAVFLGPSVPVLTVSEFRNLDDPHASAALIRGSGAYLRRDSPPAARELLTCLHDVVARVPRQWRLRPLSDGEVSELINWDVEKHRQVLARKDSD